MKFVFVGNRKFVLEEMIKIGLNVDIIVIKDTHLQNESLLNNLDFSIISSKAELLNKLESINFDVLISNGCPFILPVSRMKRKKYVNIHPSFLPDLRGIDPVLGSILFKRDAGATCHIMSEKIDAGDIISRLRIPYSNDLDASLLYQLSFIAEKKSLSNGIQKKFIATIKQEDKDDLVYYSRKEKDRFITFKESNDEIIAKIKAFNNKAQGCKFLYKGHDFKVYSVDKVYNDFLKKYSKNYNDLSIILSYEDCIIFKKDGELLKFEKIIGPLEKININSFINQNL